MTLAFPWKAEGYWGWALVFAVALGKTAGGLLTDRFGHGRSYRGFLEKKCEKRKCGQVTADSSNNLTAPPAGGAVRCAVFRSHRG
jgi:hypothetical protein